MKAEEVLFVSRPQGLPVSSNFKFQQANIAPLKDGEVLLKALYISVDPYMRGRMSEQKSYVPPFELNQPLQGGVVSEVIESKSSALQKGDNVLGMLPWSTYCVAKADGLDKLPQTTLPLSYYLGVLGMPGLTAYFGVMKICKPKAGETFVVSGAAGAVGSVVGQIAKLLGCRVVGIAGSDDKCALLKDKFHFDEVINYRTTSNLQEAVSAACPHGVDCYFDNVGGDITDAVIANINFHARIALCGQIALYNDEHASVGWRFLPVVLVHSALIQGFIVSNYQAEFAQAQQQLAVWVKEGKITYTETVQSGFNQLPEAFIGLFTGVNTGKMIVKI